MDARYIEPISIRFARDFMKLYFGSARIPHGSRCYWVAGVFEVSDTPGLYLVSADDTGLCGVLILPKAIAERGVA